MIRIYSLRSLLLQLVLAVVELILRFEVRTHDGVRPLLVSMAHLPVDAALAGLAVGRHITLVFAVVVVVFLVVMVGVVGVGAVLDAFEVLLELEFLGEGVEDLVVHDVDLLQVVVVLGGALEVLVVEVVQEGVQRQQKDVGSADTQFYH